MITYLSSGERDYYQRPVYNYRRHVWELEFLFSGSVFYTYGDKKVKLDQQGVIFSHPDSYHGWINPQNSVCGVAVIHFNEVPEALRGLLYPSGHLLTALTEQDILQCRQLFETMTALYHSPETRHSLKLESLGLRLLLLLLEKHEGKLALSPQREKEITVKNALSLFRERMNEGHGLTEVAEALGYSQSHLRRLFQAVLKQSPSEAFDALRMKIALQVLQNKNTQVSEAAWACGYGSLSAFSRAFKKHYGYAPENWRRGRH